MCLQIACKRAAAAVFAGSQSDQVTDTEVLEFKALRAPLALLLYFTTCFKSPGGLPCLTAVC